MIRLIDLLNGADCFDSWNPSIVPDSDCGIEVDICSPDCNGNGVDDAVDIVEGTSFDLDSNGQPDECQAPPPSDCSLDYGLAYHYEFEGNVLDGGSIGNHGIYCANSFSSDVPAALGSGQSISFDGVDDFVDLAEPWMLNGTDFTIAFWIRSSDHGAYILHSYGPDVNPSWNDQESLIVGPGENDTFLIYQSGWGLSLLSNPNDNTWHHIVFVHDQSVDEFGSYDAYLNGQYVASGAPERGETNPTMSRIGGAAADYSDAWFAGKLDDLRFYDRKLTPEEIELLFAGGCASDCNENGIPDSQDISSGMSSDDNGDGIPDECQGQWIELDPLSSPGPRQDHSMAFDTVRDRVVLFGGKDDGSGNGTIRFGDTWEWAGDNWQPVASEGPSPRSAQAMAFDEQGGVTVLFGGTDGSSLNDTWTWDGGQWIQHFPQSSPSARYGHAMSYDPNSGVVLLFGGAEQGGNPVNDFWQWDGGHWSQIDVGGPSARYFHRMTYDPIRQRTVLFGGIPINSGGDETWEWGGQQWELIASEISPSPRRSFGFTFDQSEKQVLLFGGCNPSLFSDTWRWDGEQWSELLLPGPSARCEVAMEFDSQRGSTILFGGVTEDVLGDTWRFGPPQTEMELDLGAGVTMELKLIPAGSFSMGSSNGDADEAPVHTVTISDAYYLGKYEVTQVQWEQLMGSNPADNPGPNHPIESISWESAVEFCDELSSLTGKTVRLPTEAEWEYACRAGTDTEYYFGADSGELPSYAWFEGNSTDTSHPVGERLPNGFGLYDMHGNVWEWCSDWYDDGYYGVSPSSDPQGPSAGELKLLRSGSTGDPAGSCRSAKRSYFSPTGTQDVWGFRVVVEAE